MSPSAPISKEILQLAVQVTNGAKGHTMDWMEHPDQVATMLETIAKKLFELNQGKP